MISRKEIRQRLRRCVVQKSGPRCNRCRRQRLAIRHYKCSFSRFHRHRWVGSDYSEVVCVDCGWCWRTKARYVGALTWMPDAVKCGSQKELRQWYRETHERGN